MSNEENEESILEIKILHFEGCPNDKPTRDLVEHILAEEKLPAAVEMVPVETEEAAEAHHFLGSPTVQVDGIDIDPSRRDDTRCALACRTYQSTNDVSGVSGVPPVEMIRAAICSSS